MHELGIVFYIIRDVEDVFNEHEELTEVKSVTLELGQVSGVIPSYLEDVWKWAIQKHEVMKNAELKIEKMPAVTYCRNCGGKYDTVKYAKVCPYCQSEDTYLLTGNQINVKSIEAV